MSLNFSREQSLTCGKKEDNSEKEILLQHGHLADADDAILDSFQLKLWYQYEYTESYNKDKIMLSYYFTWGSFFFYVRPSGWFSLVFNFWTDNTELTECINCVNVCIIHIQQYLLHLMFI